MGEKEGISIVEEEIRVELSKIADEAYELLAAGHEVEERGRDSR